MGKQKYKISRIKPAPAYRSILLSPDRLAKKTNQLAVQKAAQKEAKREKKRLVGRKLKYLFGPYSNRADMKQKQYAKPLVFKKNQKEVKVIPLKVKTSDTGQIRHFTPAAQE